MLKMRTKELIRAPGRNLPMILVSPFNDASVPAPRRAHAVCREIVLKGSARICDSRRASKLKQPRPPVWRL